MLRILSIKKVERKVEKKGRKTPSKTTFFEKRISKRRKENKTDINNKEYLQEIFEVSKYGKILCLPNSSFIRIENNKIDIIGEHYYIEYSN